MSRNVGLLCALVALALAPAASAGQTPDRAAQLEARRAARLQARQAARPAAGLGVDPYDVLAADCGPRIGFGGSPRGPSWWPPSAGPGGRLDRAGCRYPGPAAYGPGYSGGFGFYPYRGSVDYPSAVQPYPYGSAGWGYGYGYGVLPAPPNPYRDWARLWGRGWLDGEAVPPYHRFQYRFYPETLPDPTREGYVSPGEWYGAPAPRPLPAAPDCVRLELAVGDGAAEVVAIRLPALGAGTADALEAVLRSRLDRGGGVVLRTYDGHVFRFPAAESIRSMTVTPCGAPGR